MHEWWCRGSRLCEAVYCSWRRWSRRKIRTSLSRETPEVGFTVNKLTLSLLLVKHQTNSLHFLSLAELYNQNVIKSSDKVENQFKPSVVESILLRSPEFNHFEILLCDLFSLQLSCLIGSHAMQSRHHGEALAGLDSPNKVPSPPNRNVEHYESLEILSKFQYQAPSARTQSPPSEDFLATVLMQCDEFWLVVES